MRHLQTILFLVTLRKESRSGNFNGDVIQTALKYTARTVRLKVTGMKLNITADADISVRSCSMSPIKLADTVCLPDVPLSDEHPGVVDTLG